MFIKCNNNVYSFDKIQTLQAQVLYFMSITTIILHAYISYLAINTVC